MRARRRCPLARSIVTASTRTSPLVGDQPAQHAQGRRLARPVRTEQAEHFTRIHLERHIVDGCAPVEAADQMEGGKHAVW